MKKKEEKEKKMKISENRVIDFFFWKKLLTWECDFCGHKTFIELLKYQTTGCWCILGEHLKYLKFDKAENHGLSL